MCHWYYLYQNYGCNMQFGGNDQWSNMLGGTELIRRKLSKDAHAMTITLLLNSEGKKMGKTAKGAVWLDPNKTTPFDFYQYWRNVEDADVLKCIRMLTFLPMEEIEARLKRAIDEAPYMADYDYIVLNDEVENCVDKIHELVDAAKNSSNRNREFIEKMKKELAELKSGDYVYITGTIYTARDAAHKRMDDSINNKEELPVNLKNNIIYYT